ncbi:hypothetical protein ABZ805_19060 [Saccharopolyspora sp. NPDC047091]|uniref:hypothetical protein n=1 Tax=Saccharopolyspora sp. NPDC047091 TaxID=3155924 RepID=UPI0033EA3573
MTRLLGTDPFRFLVLLGSFALTWYAFRLLRDEPELPAVLLWFVAAAVAHDAVLLPLYALGDRALTGVFRRAHPAAVNHVRLPALGSGLLFLVFFPGILGLGAADHAAATGQDQEPYLGNWLLVTAVLFGLSIGWWIVRVLSRAVRGRGGSEPGKAPDLAGRTS